VFQAFGHVHSGPGAKGLDVERLGILFPTQYDVGVDNNNYEPISWAEFNEKIGKQLLKSKFKQK
jgi:calcineurin-like phosphoesterase family protein